MKSEGYGGRASGGGRNYHEPVQGECWIHQRVNCPDCGDKGRDTAYGYLGDQWGWQDDQLVTATDGPRGSLQDIENDERLLDSLATDVDAVERGALDFDEFIEIWGDEVADEYLPASARQAAEPVRSAQPWKPMGTSASPAKAPPATWSQWKPGDPYPVTYGTGKTYKSYKPFWSSAMSMEYARSTSAKSRSIGRRRDRQMGYRSCPAGRHWGPVGASGILPYAVKDDGHIYVALGKRSKAVQHGGTWAQFGGAIDKKDGGDFDAAYREINEEVDGLKGLFDEDDIVGEFRWDCPAGCGWHYTMFAVRIHLVNGKLPKLSVHKGASSWETDMLAWVPIDVVTDLELHDGFKRGWARARAAIEETEGWLAQFSDQPAGQEAGQ
jgi:8-oxo-dGTP pyrophosphatase MutT (NUDIX family)